MTRSFLLACICLTIVIAVLSGIVGFSIGSTANIDRSMERENVEEEAVPTKEEASTYIESNILADVITQEETALRIGRAILEEHFPNIMITDDQPLAARERNGIWRVETTVEKNRVDEDGKHWIRHGNVRYVEFAKINGEVLYIGEERVPDEHTYTEPTVPMVFDLAELSDYGFPRGNWSIEQLIDKYGIPEIKMASYWSELNEQRHEAVCIEVFFEVIDVRFRPLSDSGFSFYNVGEPVRNIDFEEFDLTENDRNIETEVFGLTLHGENQEFLYGIKIGQSTKAEVIAVYPEGSASTYKLSEGRVSFVNAVFYYYDSCDENGDLPEFAPLENQHVQVTYYFDEYDILESIHVSWSPEGLVRQ